VLGPGWSRHRNVIELILGLEPGSVLATVGRTHLSAKIADWCRLGRVTYFHPRIDVVRRKAEQRARLVAIVVTEMADALEIGEGRRSVVVMGEPSRRDALVVAAMKRRGWPVEHIGG